MKVLLDENGYIASFAFEGDIENAVEVSHEGMTEAQLDDLALNFRAYRLDSGAISVDIDKLNELKEQTQVEAEAPTTEERLEALEGALIEMMGVLFNG